jgi:phosphomannomutase/phosphoglucomutase
MQVQTNLNHENLNTMPLQINHSIFRQYDIRGRADTDLTDEVVYALGRAYASEIKAQGGKTIALGRDCRLSGPRLMAAFDKGVRDSGINVLQLGMVPTPLLYFALYQLECDGGVVITGSHNPGAWNGFKMCAGKSAMYGDAIHQLKHRMETSDFSAGTGSSQEVDIYPMYFSFVEKQYQKGPKQLKVVVDAGNGAGGPVVAELYRRLGFETIHLYCEPDGNFPNHHPDPTVEDNLAHLKAEIQRTGADLGLAFDGDADRIGVVDRHGRAIWGDQILIFLAKDVIRRNPGAKIVGEVKCSQVMYQEIEKAGGQAEMWKVGHSLIKARMKETGALLAGEMSGHIFIADRFFGYDDAPYVGARLLELLSHTTEDLSDWLDALPKQFNTPELRVFCPDEHKPAVMARASAHFKNLFPVVDIDGVRINFPQGWGLLRPSNTQPVLVMRFEANTVELRDEYRAMIENWLRNHAPEVDLEADTNH